MAAVEYITYRWDVTLLDKRGKLAHTLRCRKHTEVLWLYDRWKGKGRTMRAKRLHAKSRTGNTAVKQMTVELKCYADGKLVRRFFVDNASIAEAIGYIWKKKFESRSFKVVKHSSKKKS